jgi:hypothetical protein
MLRGTLPEQLGLLTELTSLCEPFLVHTVLGACAHYTADRGNGKLLFAATLV